MTGANQNPYFELRHNCIMAAAHLIVLQGPKTVIQYKKRSRLQFGSLKIHSQKVSETMMKTEKLCGGNKQK